MGMPIITPGTGTKEQALTDIIESIALQEAALAHILNCLLYTSDAADE